MLDARGRPCASTCAIGSLQKAVSFWGDWREFEVISLGNLKMSLGPGT